MSVQPVKFLEALHSKAAWEAVFHSPLNRHSLPSNRMLVKTALTIKGHQIIQEPEILNMARVIEEIFKKRRSPAKITHEMEVVYS